MAKVAFTKLGLKKNTEIKTFIWNEQTVEVKQYLPIQEKLELIQKIIELAGEQDEGFYNIIKLELYYKIETLKKYTNISFTEKQLEDVCKLYDLITINKLWDEFLKNIPEEESNYLWNNICNIAKEVTTYNSSVAGILSAVGQDYALSSLSLQDLAKTIQDPNQLGMIKDIIPLLNE